MRITSVLEIDDLGILSRDHIFLIVVLTCPETERERDRLTVVRKTLTFRICLDRFDQGHVRSILLRGLVVVVHIGTHIVRKVRTDRGIVPVFEREARDKYFRNIRVVLLRVRDTIE